MFRSANPALTQEVFTKESLLTTEETMTIQGCVNKTLLLLFMVMFPASFVWVKFFQGVNIMPFMIGGAIGGFIFAIITIFKRSWAPYTAPLYATAQGVFLGGVSGFMESMYPGIVLQAVALTFGTLLSLLLAYKSGFIKATPGFKRGVFAATGAIAFIYFITFILGFFGIQIPFIHSNGLLGIGFSLVVVVIAALNLVMDFDFIEKGSESGAPKYMEWYAAFGLMVTLIWLYIEFLRLLSKLRSRN